MTLNFFVGVVILWPISFSCYAKTVLFYDNVERVDINQHNFYGCKNNKLLYSEKADVGTTCLGKNDGVIYVSPMFSYSGMYSYRLIAYKTNADLDKGFHKAKLYPKLGALRSDTINGKKIYYSFTERFLINKGFDGIEAAGVRPWQILMQWKGSHPSNSGLNPKISVGLTAEMLEGKLFRNIQLTVLDPQMNSRRGRFCKKKYFRVKGDINRIAGGIKKHKWYKLRVELYIDDKGEVNVYLSKNGGKEKRIISVHSINLLDQIKNEINCEGTGSTMLGFGYANYLSNRSFYRQVESTNSIYDLFIDDLEIFMEKK